MSPDLVLQLMSRLLWTGVLISAPVLLTALVVGVAVSIVQAVTQIQEMSLSFIPKILAVVAVLIIFGSWMLKQLVNFSSAIIISIPDYL